MQRSFLIYCIIKYTLSLSSLNKLVSDTFNKHFYFFKTAKLSTSKLLKFYQTTTTATPRPTAKVTWHGGKISRKGEITPTHLIWISRVLVLIHIYIPRRPTKIISKSGRRSFYSWPNQPRATCAWDKYIYLYISTGRSLSESSGAYSLPGTISHTRGI